MDRKLGTMIAAIMLAAQLGSPLAAQEASLEQLTEISAYLGDNDVQALRAYLLRYPELLEGDTELARLLREFMGESENVTAFLGFEPDLNDEVERSIRRPRLILLPPVVAAAATGPARRTIATAPVPAFTLTPAQAQAQARIDPAAVDSAAVDSAAVDPAVPETSIY